MLPQIFYKKSAVAKLADVRFAYWGIGFLFFCYVLARAILVGATFDEAWSMGIAGERSVFHILVNKIGHANNHTLNTLLIKLLFLFDYGSLFLARLPNVMAFVFYAYFGYKIAFRNLSPFVGIGFFVLLLCNPFLLEFFGLARGYGLSITFMMGALYFSSELIKSFSRQKLWWSLILGALSVVSVFSMIYFFVALVATLVLIPLLRKDVNVFKQTLSRSLLAGLILFPVFFVSVWRMYKYGALFYGGTRNLYSDTLFSLIEYSLFDSSFSFPVLNTFLVIVSLTAVAAFFYRREQFLLRDMFTLVTVALVVMIILAHYLGGVRYPIDRVALFFYPSSILVLCFCLDGILRRIKGVFLFLLVVACMTNFSLAANLYKTKIWQFDAHTSKILAEINNRGKQQGRVMAVAYSPILSGSLGYYLTRYDYPFVSVLDKYENGAAIGHVDYYMYFEEEQGVDNAFADTWAEPLSASHTDVFLEYPEEGVYVYAKSPISSPSP